jgi:hypothetical protein
MVLFTRRVALRRGCLAAQELDGFLRDINEVAEAIGFTSVVEYVSAETDASGYRGLNLRASYQARSNPVPFVTSNVFRVVSN